MREFHDVQQGHMRCWFMKKTETQKYHTTVPLMGKQGATEEALERKKLYV
jgi:hypothetical protein